MINAFIFSFIFALQIAVIAYVYVVILTQPDMILYRLHQWAEKRLPVWLFKPLIGCQLCVAGQLSLWGWLFTSIVRPIDILDTIGWAYTVCLSIFLAHIISHLISKLER